MSCTYGCVCPLPRFSAPSPQAVPPGSTSIQPPAWPAHPLSPLGWPSLRTLLLRQGPDILAGLGEAGPSFPWDRGAQPWMNELHLTPMPTPARDGLGRCQPVTASCKSMPWPDAAPSLAVFPPVPAPGRAGLVSSGSENTPSVSPWSFHMGKGCSSVPQLRAVSPGRA